MRQRDGTRPDEIRRGRERHQPEWSGRRARLAPVAVAMALMWSIPIEAVAEEEKIPMSPSPTTVPAAQNLSPTSQSIDSLAGADCQGCSAGFGLWDGVLNIQALRESRTNEVVTRIHVHGTIIRALNDSCAGDWRFGEQVDNFALTGSNTSSWQTHDETYWQGSQHSWGNVGAHEWEDDGASWDVGTNGETDLCKTF